MRVLKKKRINKWEEVKTLCNMCGKNIYTLVNFTKPAVGLIHTSEDYLCTKDFYQTSREFDLCDKCLYELISKFKHKAEEKKLKKKK